MALALHYRALRGIIRTILKLYYRSIESYGTNFIPRGGRTLFIANHQAGLIDGILILGTNSQVVRLLVKHTLWKEPVVSFFATGLGMIPVYRKQDLTPEQLKESGESHNRHKKSFDGMTRALLKNENVLVFPEGVSHDGPHMLKLKSGAARMLLDTEAHHDFRLGVSWLPVSLDLEVKDKPGSRVLIHYHPPRRIEHYRELYLRDPEAAIEELRHEMESYLYEITLNFATWENRIFLERLTEVWLCQAPNEALLDRHNQLLKWKRVLEQSVTSEDRNEWDRLRAKLEVLQNTLDLTGLTPEEIMRKDLKGRKTITAKLLPTLLGWAPMIVFGMIFWWVPTWLIKLITRKGAQSFRDVVATYHVVSSLVVLPIWLVLTIGLAAGVAGPWVATGLALISISSGLSLLISARRLRLEFTELFNMYRYGKENGTVARAQREIRDVLLVAAKLWNRALAKQVIMEEAPKRL